jgi:diketogulonate reductase-like aldo/keto reductase
MNDIASKYDATPSQVALNWLVRNGVLPIPGIKSATQATDNAASMNWDLSDDEFAILSDAT